MTSWGSEFQLLPKVNRCRILVPVSLLEDLYGVSKKMFSSMCISCVSIWCKMCQTFRGETKNHHWPTNRPDIPCGFQGMFSPHLPSNLRCLLSNVHFLLVWNQIPWFSLFDWFPDWFHDDDGRIGRQAQHVGLSLTFFNSAVMFHLGISFIRSPQKGRNLKSEICAWSIVNGSLDWWHVQKKKNGCCSQVYYAVTCHYRCIYIYRLFWVGWSFTSSAEQKRNMRSQPPKLAQHFRLWKCLT